MEVREHQKSINTELIQRGRSMEALLNEVERLNDETREQRVELSDMKKTFNELMSKMVEILGKPAPEKQQFEIAGVKMIEIKGDKGDKGDPGYTPRRGIDYFKSDEIRYFIEAATPENGVDYFTEKEISRFKKEVTPVKGRDYRDGKDSTVPGPRGLPGISIKGDPGKDANMTAEKIVQRINSGSALIDVSKIKNLPRAERRRVKMGGGGGGSLNILTATGDINDTNRTFTFTAVPSLVVVNGIMYRSTGGVGSITWTISGLTVTLSQAVGTDGDIYGIQ